MQKKRSGVNVGEKEAADGAEVKDKEEEVGGEEEADGVGGGQRLSGADYCPAIGRYPRDPPPGGRVEKGVERLAREEKGADEEDKEQNRR